MKKSNHKLKEMTEDELKAWEKKFKEVENDNIRKDAYNKIQGGRGWIF